MKNRFDIDLVYLWVDGNDKEWLTKKYEFLGKNINLNTEATSIARNANNDELKYSLRSIEKHAPWIRKIFIITDGQTPRWLNLKNKKVKIVDIREIIPPEALPCYNSVIIEHFIYKIPELGEHFLYANDDMFLNANVTPADFFTNKGFPIIRLQRFFMGKSMNYLRKLLKIHTNIYRKTIENSARLVEAKFGCYFAGTPHHNIDSFLKTDYHNVVEIDFKEEIHSTITNHIRSENDIQRIIYLYYALAQKKGVLRYVGRSESCRIRLQQNDFMSFINTYNPIFFCLNDTHRATNNDRMRVKPFLETLFPQKSDFEN
jgi:hypothetical protein